MSDSQPNYYYQDMIDLREVMETLYVRKWVILSITVVLAGITFLVSSFLLPKGYTASAFVTIREPVLTAELDQSIRVSPNVPDSQALTDLAEADSVLKTVREDLDIKRGEVKYEASLKGSSQLLLEVTAGSPEKSAAIANSWAATFVSRLNELYGTGEKSLSTLESETENAREKWNSAQNALEAYLPESKVEVLEVQLADTKNALQRYLNKIEHNQILISDAKVLLAQMSEQEGDDFLSPGFSLSIIALQQRASGGVSGTQFEIKESELLGQEYSVSEGRGDIQGLITALEEQIDELEEEIPILESRISELSVDYEAEKYKVERFVQERDLARNAYHALANQLEETRIKRSQEEYSAKIATQAIPPDEVSHPRTELYTALAGLVGLITSGVGVLLHEWWRHAE